MGNRIIVTVGKRESSHQRAWLANPHRRRLAGIVLASLLHASIPTRSCADSEHFEAVAENLDLGGEYFAYVDLSGDIGRLTQVVMKGANGFFQEAAGRPFPFPAAALNQVFTAVGASSIGAVGMSSVQDGDYFLNRVYVHLPAGRDGIFRFFGGDPQPFEVLRVAPENTVLAWEADLDIASVRETVKAAATALLGAIGASQVDSMLSRPAGNAPGVPTWLEIVRLLKGRWMAVVVTYDGPRLQLTAGDNQPTLPRFDYFISVDNLGKILPRLRPNYEALDFFKVRENETALEIVLDLEKVVPGLIGFDFRPCVALDKPTGRLVVASSYAFYRRCVEPRRDGGTLRDRPDFKVLAAGLPQEGNRFGFVSGEFIREVVEALIAAERSTAPLTRERETLLRELMGYFHGNAYRGTLAVGVNRPDGFHSVSRSAVSLKDAVLLQAGTLAATSVSALQRIGRTTQEKQVHNNLRLIAIAADQFVIEEDKPEIRLEDVVGPGRLLERLPLPVAGEDYSRLFPIRGDYVALEVITADGRTVRYAP